MDRKAVVKGAAVLPGSTCVTRACGSRISMRSAEVGFSKLKPGLAACKEPPFKQIANELLALSKTLNFPLLNIASDWLVKDGKV